LIAGIVVLALLVLLSGFFSSMETAYFSLSDIDLIEIEKSSRKNRKIVLGLLKHKEKLLSTILIGNNIVNISAGSLNAFLAQRYASQYGFSPEFAITISAIILTIIILIFGEIIPKTYAIYNNRELGLFFAPVILGFSIIIGPITYFFNKFNLLLNRVFKNKKKKTHKISEKTVINVISKGEEQGVINEREKKLIQNVFQFDDMEVYPIMTPRTSVFALKDSMKLSEVRNILLEKQFSRIPIYKDTIDNITGVINLKTILQDMLNGDQNIKLIALAQEPIFVYETLSISALLEQFKSKRTHLAIVVDEFGGMAGLVTLEDVLEELVGEIYDEKDAIDTSIRKTDPNKWLINGKTDIITINKNIEGEIIINGDFNTLQGLIMSYLERIPVVGDFLFVNPHRFKVINMERNEITSVLVEYSPEEGQEDEEQITGSNYS
jgi:putative hemolysin